MNKFQRRESRMIKRMNNDIDLIGMPFSFDHYKAFRRGIRKTARMLIKANKEAHKKALSKAVNDKDAIIGIDLANGRDQTAYNRQDLFNTICVAKPIEVKNE